MTTRPSAKIKTDMNAAEGKEALTRLSRCTRSGILIEAEIDEEADHTKSITVTDPTPVGQLVPRFDFDYQLLEHGKFHLMSWKDSVITYEEATFLYAFLMLLKPRTVVETGTGLALSTLHMAQALADAGKGEIFTIENNSAFVRRAVQAVNGYGFKEFVTIVSQQSTTYLEKWERPTDFAFLDSCFPTVQQEFDLIAPHIKVGGYVVSRYTLALPGNGVWRYMEMPAPHGLHVYQKRDEGSQPDETVNKAKKPIKKKPVEKFVPEQRKKSEPTAAEAAKKLAKAVRKGAK